MQRDTTPVVVAGLNLDNPLSGLILVMTGDNCRTDQFQYVLTCHEQPVVAPAFTGWSCCYGLQPNQTDVTDESNTSLLCGD